MNRFGIIGYKRDVLDYVAEIKKKYPHLHMNDLYFLGSGDGEHLYSGNVDGFVQNNDAVILLSPTDNLKSSLLNWIQYQTPIYLDFFPELTPGDIDELAKACDETGANIIVKSVYPYALSLKRDLDLGEGIQYINFRRHGIGELISKSEIVKDLITILNLFGRDVKNSDVVVYKNKSGKDDGYTIYCELSYYGFYKATLLWNIASLDDCCTLDIYSKERYLSINLNHTNCRTEPNLSKAMEEKIEYKRDIIRFFDIVSALEVENSFKYIADSYRIANKIFSRL
ncbi:MAG: hypothetical protein ACK5MG_05080 [Bacteroidales bacterium]